MASSSKHQDDLFSAGDWFYWKCEYENAKKHFQTIAVQPSLSNSDLIRCYKSLAATEVELKDYDEALNIYMKELNLLEKIRDSTTKNDDLMSCCLSIGKVYWLKSEYNHAIIYHRRALKYAQSTQNISSIYKNLANIYTSAKNTYSAVEYFNDALKIDNECPSKSNLHLGQTYANMGTMYQAEENYQEALKYFEQAQKTLSETLPDTHIAIRKLNKTIRQLEINLKTTDNIQSDTISSIATQPVDHLDIFAENNIMILWLDDHIGQDDNCRALKKEFRQITNSFKMFDSPESFRQCLPYVKDRKLFCIIQDKYGKEVVPDIDRIVSPSMEPVVYIFCLNIKYLVEWALGQKCVMRDSIFDHEQNLLERLKRDVENYIKKQSINIEKEVSLESINESIDQIMQIVESCRNVTNVTTPSKETPIISN